MRRLLTILVIPFSLALFGCDSDYGEGGAWEDTREDVEVHEDENVIEDDGVGIYENEEIIEED